MDQDFVEAMLSWKTGADRTAVVRWLRERGLNSLPMKAGLLINGPRAAFETTFATDLSGKPPAEPLAPPEEMRQHIESIRIPRLRQIQTKNPNNKNT